MHNTERLELMVNQLHGYLRTDIRYGESFLPAPFMIEFTGSPDAGKTTCIKELDKFLHRSDFRVFIPQEGAEAIRHIHRKTPEYNLRTGLYALNMLIDFAHSHTYDIVIFDRAIFDAYTWMIYWEEKGLITGEERELHQRFFLSNPWVHRIIAAYIVTCDPAEAVRRGQRIAASKEKLGDCSNPESVRKSVLRHQRMFDELSPKFPQLTMIDTTKMNEEEMISLITTTTMEALIKQASALRDRG